MERDSTAGGAEDLLLEGKISKLASFSFTHFFSRLYYNVALRVVTFGKREIPSAGHLLLDLIHKHPW